MTTAEPTLHIIRDDQHWQRLGWHAQQRWLHNARKLRAQLIADLNERLAREAAARASRQGDTAAAQAILDTLPSDPQGQERLAFLNAEADRASNARRMRAVRSETQAKEAS